jgi:hypothetical protein
MTRPPFWYPLRWWHAAGIFLLAQVVANMGLGLLRGAGLEFLPPWLGGGIGGVLGVLGVMALAKTKKDKPS